ncbi:MAG TPA: glycosyltransferase family 39 protein, partial [Myxococcaceae bacterium]|nr:glycosyltransferase family 39 protein [Myxococcaceae bacterium]
MADSMVQIRASDEVRRWSVWTGVLIAGTTLLRFLFVSATGVTNGEAYYYLWSRFPSLSYYDHPPLVAWMAWATTRFSHGSMAIRVGPMLCAAVFSVLVYRLGARLFSPRAGFYGVAIVTIIPIFFASSYVLNPEAPLAPLWVLGLLLIEGMREHDEAWRPLAVGLVTGLAFLAKYSGVLLFAVGLLYVLVSPTGRRWLRRPSLYLAGPVALVVALPVLIWNQQRGWPSLMLHFVERTGTRDPATLAVNVWHAIGDQFAPFHPLMFPGLLVVLALCIRRAPRDDRVRFLAVASGPVLLFFLLMMARVRDPESHWTMVSYIPLAVAGGGLLDERSGRLPAWLRVYVAACLAVTVAAIAGFYAYASHPGIRRLMPAGSYDADKDFFNEMPGWSQVREVVAETAPTLGPDTVVASGQYALCAHVLTALDDRPNVYCPGPRRTEFDFIARRDPPPGAPVLYIHDAHY